MSCRGGDYIFIGGLAETIRRRAGVRDVIIIRATPKRTGAIGSFQTPNLLQDDRNLTTKPHCQNTLIDCVYYQARRFGFGRRLYIAWDDPSRVHASHDASRQASLTRRITTCKASHSTSER